MRDRAKGIGFTLVIVVGCIFSTQLAWAEPQANPCAGAAALLSLVDRPTASDSACVVPDRSFVLEAGYQYQKTYRQAYQQNFPQAELRFGLPASNELVLVLPNDIRLSSPSQSGLSSLTLGIKHELGHAKKWVVAVESLFTPRSGSKPFGNDRLGVALNAMVSYNLTDQWNVSGMFGVVSQTQSQGDGGQRYTSVNPDIVISYTLTDDSDVYVEVYGQSRTAPHQSSGFNVDTGFLFLVSKQLSLDIEIGQRISGLLGGFNHYLGAGLALQLTS